MKKGFTLIELLVVIAVMTLLMGVLLPALSQVSLQAKIVAVNTELRQIGLALEYYFSDYEKYPPTREDCNTGVLEDHLYQLPEQLADCRMLPSTNKNNVMATITEDRFNSGHTYKYRSVGECIRDRDIIDKWITSRLWVPDGFPGKSSVEAEQGQWYKDPAKTPIKWVLFSLGPNYDRQWIEETLENRYPVPKEIWNDVGRKKGFLVRLHLQNGNEIGSFEGQ
ncbi:MAG: type II secretion system protein [Sedimentisphaerales bacterium]|nr:type II secretion system protein [Sedimentisphaerales bacterium]